MPNLRAATFTLLLAGLSGCAQVGRVPVGGSNSPAVTQPTATESLAQPTSLETAAQIPRTGDRVPVTQVANTDSFRRDDEVLPAAATVAAQPPERLPTPTPEPLDPARNPPPRQETLELEQVLQSVRMHFPLVRAAFAAREVASGEVLSAFGAFDHKLAAASENDALGFYENYRQGFGIERNTFGGGKVFGGYRIGRGSFQPWYLERQTNDGGEFKAGFAVPLSSNRWIDQNRAALWQARIGRRQVEPEIQTELIAYFNEASVVYWDWVAAAQFVRVADSLLMNARAREEGLKRQVATGDKARIVLTDNRRLIVSREAILIDTLRKLRQSEVKLSLFLRNPDGSPQLVSVNPAKVDFPPIGDLNEFLLADDIGMALANRPETRVLDLTAEQLGVQLRQAENETLPAIDAKVAGSQDVGAPTSSKRDKSPFQTRGRADAGGAFGTEKGTR